MFCTTGTPLIPELKEVIVTLKNYFDRNKSQFQKQDSSTQMVADALEISLTTVERVMASYRKNPESLHEFPHQKGHRLHSINPSHQVLVREFIRNKNLNGELITLDMITHFLKQQYPEDKYHVRTLGKTLNRWGFEFGRGKRTQHLKEKDSVILARQKYLRIKRANRHADGTSTLKPEVYLDESYINKNHSNDFTWYYGEDDAWVQKPSGKGERLIIMNAITSEGWVPKAKLVFKSSRKTGDYHGDVDAKQFQKWFKELLIPNIPEKSYIIIDNAPYHNELSLLSPPTPGSKKREIRKWLEENGYPCSKDCLKVELIEILKQANPKPIYEIDLIANEHGHTILRLPPYHPELQPIETCWAIVKNDVARHCDFTMENMMHQLETAFHKVTKKTCIDLMKKMQKQEDEYWQEDSALDGDS